MFSLTDAQLEAAREAIMAASQREDVRVAVRDVYQDVQKAIDKRRPICVISGRCCRFEEFGHNLYVTTMEMAAFLRELESSGRSMPPPQGGGCPFQINKLCSVHAIRPFGCRLFFCDATSTEWQQEQYQHFHRRLRVLHDELEVPYFYLEWRQALGIAIDQSPAGQRKVSF
jgi:Fe-S-cluster containining protein